MNREDLLISLSLFLAVYLLWPVFPAGAQQTLTILHTSEHHGQVLPIERMGQKREGGMAARARVIADVRKAAQDVLLVDSGDLLIGTPMSSVFRGEPDIKAMNLMRYQALATGNHEFDFGLDHLRTLQAFAHFPLLCSNLIGKEVELPCRASVVVPVGDLSIGLISLLGRKNFPDTFNREVVRLLDLRDPIETARASARTLKQGGAHLVVAVTHQEDDEDLALLSQVPEIDAVIGGHTLGFDGLRTAGSVEPVAEATQPGPVFVKTHRQGRTIGRLDLTLDRMPDDPAKVIVVKAEARNLPIGENIQPDQSVQELTEDYVRKMDMLGATVVGRSLVNLDGETTTVRTRESNLGNLLADLARSEFGTDLALVNSGQIRDSIPAGPVDLTRVLRVLPFGSTLVTLSISGQELRAALENSVSRLPATNGRFLQVSGVTVTYDPQAPIGSRVREVMVGDKPLDPFRRYRVTTDSFVADGGDGYTMLQQAQDRIERQVPLRDLLLQALKERPLKASLDGRIRFAELANPN
jgi:5'-nucleotidase